MMRNQRTAEWSRFAYKDQRDTVSITNDLFNSCRKRRRRTVKILFINLPYYGHFIPTVGLVQELIELNYEVAYMMPYGWEKEVEESGASFIGYPNHKKLSEQIKNVIAAAEKVIMEYDLIIYEQFFFLGKHLARKYKKPVVRIFTAPVANKKLMDEYISAGGALGIFKYAWIGRRWTKKLAKGIPLKTDNWLDEIIYNPPKLNLVYTLQEYQPYAEEFPSEQYKFIGPSTYNRKNTVFEFTKTNPLIYISLGTVVKGSTRFFKKCFKAFEDQPVDVIISTGQQLPLKRIKHIPDNIHIHKTVPQIEVLKLADVFVTHGGMNSVSEALVQGVPMVVIPFIADQPVNANRVEELGLGKKLEYKQINSEELRSIVFSVISDEGIKTNTLNMQRLMTNAPGNSGGARMIDDFYQNYLIENSIGL